MENENEVNIAETQITKKKSPLLFIIIATIIIIAGVVIYFSFFSTAAVRNREVKAHLASAEKYLEDKDYENAIAEYEAILKLDPQADGVLNDYVDTVLAYTDETGAEDSDKAKDIFANAISFLEKLDGEDGAYDEYINKLKEEQDKYEEETTDEVEESDTLEEISDDFFSTDNEIEEVKEKISEKIDMGSYQGITLKWSVLEDTGDTKLLILDGVIPGEWISDDISYDTYVCWKDSNLRKWLNNDFYKDCFSDDERAKILKSTIATAEITNANPDSFEWSDPIETDDYIYCLSVTEYEQYYNIDNRGYNGLYVYSMDGICAGIDGSGRNVESDFVSQYVYDDRCVGMTALSWYLRETSPDGTEGLVTGLMGTSWLVDINGATHPFNMEFIYGVRPVMLISY